MTDRTGVWTEKRGARTLVRWRDLGSGEKRSKSFADAKSAAIFASEQRTAMLRGDVADDAIRTVTLAAYVKKTLVADPDLRRSTFVTYSRLAERHLNGLGSRTLGELENDPQLIQKAIDAMPGGPSLKRQMRNLLSRTFKRAIIEHPRAKIVNPVKATRSPKVARKRDMNDRLITREQVHGIADTIEPSLSAAVLLRWYCGLREGEVGALRPQDIDFEHSRVKIGATVSKTDRGAPAIEAPKTGKPRVVAMPKIVAEALRKHLGAYPAERIDKTQWPNVRLPADGLVFSSLRGHILDASAMAHHYRKATKKLGITGARFHDLRHSHATDLIERGIPLKVVSERLGHSTITITADIYQHVTAGMDNAVAALFNAEGAA
ncbi:MAG: tyrosine-type recombinase/integrase [Actinomycetota bacterium]